MSAARLRNNKKCNELEDDRESCLHVLTWMALRFTKHTCSKGDSSMFLRAFDEEYQDNEGVKGGDLKRGFLATREIPCVVKFDRRPQLDSLIEELTEAFAVRYEKPPSANQFDVLNQMRSSNVPSSFLEENTAFKYQKRLDNLVARNWLVDVFRRYLDTNPWPSSDQSHGQLIGTGSNKKRAREQGKLEQRIPRSKSQRFSDGSGSHSGSRVPSDDEEVD
jgi:hypothetical protein